MDQDKPLSHDEKISMLFANMVMQQANTALMFMGKVKHPESGETVTDLDAARFFIDQLEVLSVKTKGNLNKDEESLLQQSLMTVRMAFVEAFSGAAAQSVANKGAETSTPEAAPQVEPNEASKTAESEGKAPEAPAATPSEEDTKKKFVKKY